MERFSRYIKASIALFLLLLFLSPGMVHAQVQEDDVYMVSGKEVRLTSKELQEERTLYISLPPGHEEGERAYPVLYLLDGSPAVLTMARVAQFGHAFPPLIVVAIANTDRTRDLSRENIGDPWPTSGGADKFLAFITQELIPYIDRTYRTTPFRIISGGSAAGRFTLHTMINASEYFDGYIAQSPMLGTDFEYLYGETERRLKTPALRGKFLFLCHGGDDYPGVTIYSQKYVRLFEGFSRPDFEFHYRVYPHEGHFQVQALHDGLTELFSDYGLPVDVFIKSGETGMKSHLAALQKKYHQPLAFDEVYSEADARDKGCSLIRDHEFQKAVMVLADGCKRFPDSVSLHYYLAQAYQHAGEPKKAVLFFNKALGLKPSSGTEGMIRIFLKQVEK